MDINDVIFSLGGVSQITKPLSIDATDAQITTHLSEDVIGDNVPTLAQVKAQILVYQAQVEATKNPTPEQLQALVNEKVKAELLELDSASIRAMREYIASKADAPQILKDREASAIATRGKLK